MTFKTIVFIFISIFYVPGFGANSNRHPLVGQSELNIFIGKKLFKDKVTIEEVKPGQYRGTLVVPKAFTAKLENIMLSSNRFSFEIEADEGKGKFRVRYEGELHANGKVFKGFATLPLKNNDLLGGFVGAVH